MQKGQDNPAMSSSQNYAAEILKIYDNAVRVLTRQGIKRENVDYRRGYKFPRRPSAAYSESLINQRLAEWTEATLKASFNQQSKNYVAVNYAAGGRLIAGESGFVDVFNKYHSEIRVIGKRPDLLVFDRGTVKRLNLTEDISEMEPQRLIIMARKAARALVVKPGRYLAAQYRKAKGQEQSFTPKLEDLPVITHWIVEHRVPCFYTQVFFDEAYIISFEKILRIVEETGTERMDEVGKNQGKSIFYIPVTEGVLAGQIAEAPKWEAATKVMADGRVIIYASPSGGRMELKEEMMQYLQL
jgi:hypothetical protein